MIEAERLKGSISLLFKGTKVRNRGYIINDIAILGA